MARTVGSSGQKTMEAIRSAGLDLIYEFGYEGMSLRQLAAKVGIQQESLYNQIRSKQDLLLDLIRDHMETLLEALDTTLVSVESPLDGLRSFVDFHVTYHVKRKREVFVVNSELRSLEPPNTGSRPSCAAFMNASSSRSCNPASPRAPSRSPMFPWRRSASSACCREYVRGTIRKAGSTGRHFRRSMSRWS